MRVGGARILSYHVPMFMLTNYARAPLIMEGGATFHFARFGCASR